MHIKIAILLPMESIESDDSQELSFTAYHEAGRAVIGYRLGFQGLELSIIPDEEKGTLGHHAQEDWDQTTESAKNKVIALYAGGEAARIAFFPERGLLGTGRDDEKATHILQFSEGETEAKLRAEAIRMIEENWAQISAVAQELKHKKSLIWDEWMVIVESIDEGESWEETLAEFRVRARLFGILPKEK